MQIIRREIYELIEYERQFNREKNARYRLMERVMASCLKTIDLWEERVSTMFTIDTIGVKTEEMKEDLSKRVTKRLGLEGDNEGLRGEIAALRENLDKKRAENNSKDTRLRSLRTQLKDETELHKSLTNKVKTAQSHSTILKSALESSFAELEDIVSDNANSFQVDDVFEE